MIMMITFYILNYFCAWRIECEVGDYRSEMATAYIYYYLK